MISLIIITSFILEGILSLYLPFSIDKLSFLYPQLVLISLIIIYPFYKKKKYFYMSLIIIGLIYDLVYTDTLLLHSFLFFIMGLAIDEYYVNIGNSKRGFILLSLIVIFLYNSLYYLLLVLFQNIDFSIYSLFYKIFHSYLFTIFYGYILYIVLQVNKQKMYKYKK